MKSDLFYKSLWFIIVSIIMNLMSVGESFVLVVLFGGIKGIIFALLFLNHPKLQSLLKYLSFLVMLLIFTNIISHFILQGFQNA